MHCRRGQGSSCLESFSPSQTPWLSPSPVGVPQARPLKVRAQGAQELALPVPGPGVASSGVAWPATPYTADASLTRLGQQLWGSKTLVWIWTGWAARLSASWEPWPGGQEQGLPRGWAHHLRTLCPLLRDEKTEVWMGEAAASGCKGQ